MNEQSKKMALSWTTPLTIKSYCTMVDAQPKMGQPGCTLSVIPTKKTVAPGQKERYNVETLTGIWTGIWTVEVTMPNNT